MVPILDERSRWLIGSRDLNIWSEDWTGAGRLSSIAVAPIPDDLKNLQVKDNVSSEGLTSLTPLSSIFPWAVLDQISQEGICTSQGPNRRIRTCFSSVCFEIRSAWDLIRPSDSHKSWAYWVWHSKLPPKISMFAWRLLHDVFPVEGNLQFKDFDIRKEADGVSNSAVLKTFMVNVSKNFLEIHLFWAGKGTCCIPVFGIYGPSISAISVTPALPSDFPPLTASGDKNKNGLIVGIVVGVGALIFISISGIFIWRQMSGGIHFISISGIFFWRRRSRGIHEDQELQEMGAERNTTSYTELRTDTGDFRSELNTFSYSQLRRATENFSPENKLGEGGFGAVYKGTFSGGRIVAVKKLSMAFHDAEHQFLTEIITISAAQHPNLVKLYGYCIEGDERILVYEYVENNSLDRALFGNRTTPLDWPTRYKICLGTAQGFTYLHEELRPRIIHRDVKAGNILLDAEFNPKISDFGLAKLFHDNRTHISTRVAGTRGYLAPEYEQSGQLTEKADVYGFGVVTLEILSGRRNTARLDQDRISLLIWAWNLHEANRPLELIDRTLNEFDEGQALRIFQVAILCTQEFEQRPPMSNVVAMLSGGIEVSTVTSRPRHLTPLQFNGLLAP